MIIPFLILYNTISCFASMAIGFYLISKPETIIEMQRQFYARINWKIEPISMEKELHNTRLMGYLIIVLSLIPIIYLVIRKGVP